MIEEKQRYKTLDGKETILLTKKEAKGLQLFSRVLLVGYLISVPFLYNLGKSSSDKSFYKITKESILNLPKNLEKEISYSEKWPNKMFNTNF
ncbi:hypothetical protein GW931_00380 [archaeon]|nr:hypothetical protein [archaeon]PJC45483.1 MAG: hypothetical protein CO037_01235 [Candidatus Pacearchaeota archaeon CG_4_9_14_0_2_um_filter_30_8]